MIAEQLEKQRLDRDKPIEKPKLKPKKEEKKESDITE